MKIPRIITGILAEDWEGYPKGETTISLCTTLLDEKNAPCSVSLPNPVPAYLDIAQNSLEGAKELRSKLIVGKTVFPKSTGHEEFLDIDQEIFDQYFQICAVITTTAVMSLEAWCNQMIPENYVYEYERNGKKYSRTKDDIQRWISLDEKLSTLIPRITNKQPFKNDRLWARYKKMVAARDDFVHLKYAKTGQDPTGYDEFFQKIFSLPLDDIVQTPEDIMRYFIPEELGF